MGSFRSVRLWKRKICERKQPDVHGLGAQVMTWVQIILIKFRSFKIMFYLGRYKSEIKYPNHRNRLIM